MEDLICQAFDHVGIIGQHVQERHYDLMGPNGEIILPQVWETVVEPNWSISMHMWPMEEPEKPKEPPPLHPPGALDGMFSVDVGPLPKKAGKNKKGKDKMMPPPPPPIPSVGPGGGGPANFDAILAQAPMPPAHGGAGVMMPPDFGAVKSLGSKKKKELTPMMAWMAGGSRKPGSGKGEKELDLLAATGGAGSGSQRMREPAKKVVATSEGMFCVVM